MDPKGTSNERAGTDQAGPIGIAYYAAARAEVVQRLAMREQVLLAYLTVSGVVASMAAGRPPGADRNLLLLVIPVMAGPFTIAFWRHDTIIRLIGTYVRRELRPFRRLVPFPDWDGSDALHGSREHFLVWEKLTFTLLILLPCSIALFLGAGPVGRAGATINWVWWAAALSAGGSGVYLVRDLTRVRTTPPLIAGEPPANVPPPGTLPESPS